MSLPATDLSGISHAEPVFLNLRSEIVHPVCFAVVYWDAPADTLYAFEDKQAFERQFLTAERHGAHVQVMSYPKQPVGLRGAVEPHSTKCRLPASRHSAI